MKVFSLALIALLLAAIWTESQGVSFRSPSSKCCYKDMFYNKKIHSSFIRSYQNTPSHCSHRAVRVELLKGKKLCVDPKKPWFRKYLQEKNSTSTSM